MRPDVTSRPPRVAGARATGVILFLSFMDVATLLTIVGNRAEELGAGPIGVGLAVGAYSATNLPANVVGGILLDRIGRRRLTIAGFIAAALAVLSYGVAASPATFILVRGVHGIAGGILVTAVFAVAGDRTRAGRAGRSFGRFGAIIGSAWVVGPALAGVLVARSDTRAVFQLVAGLLVIGAVITSAFIREIAVAESDDPTAGADAVTDDATSRMAAMRALSSRPPVRRALLATMAWMAAVGTLAAFLRSTVEAVGAPPAAANGLFSAYALMAGLMMLSPLAARVDRVGADGLIATGLGITGLAFLVLASAEHRAPDGLELVVLAVGSALFGIGYGIVFPAVTAVISLAATTRTRGRAFGLFNVAFSSGLAIGPPASGALVALVSRASQGSFELDPFLPAALLCLLVATRITRAGRAERAGAVEHRTR